MRHHLFRNLSLMAVIAAGLGLAVIYAAYGQYGFSSFIQRGITRWIDVSNSDARFTPSMQMALQPNSPVAVAGIYKWETVAPGLDITELPVLADGTEVDRILLSRVDPSQYRFVVRNQPSGIRSPEEWLHHLGAAVVINGSYYGHHGLPDTPFLEDGTLLGPSDYKAEQGAFVVEPGKTSIVDLAKQRWQDVFANAQETLVSYPLLVAPGDQQHTIAHSRWLANRSFVGQDMDGKIVFGTTVNGFFSLDRLAVFLRASPLNLKAALNLDGGPVASQAVYTDRLVRNFRGQWEVQVTPDGQTKLLTWPWGSWGLPVVIAAVKKGQ